MRQSTLQYSSSVMVDFAEHSFAAIYIYIEAVYGTDAFHSLCVSVSVIHSVPPNTLTHTHTHPIAKMKKKIKQPTMV